MGRTTGFTQQVQHEAQQKGIMGRLGAGTASIKDITSVDVGAKPKKRGLLDAYEDYKTTRQMKKILSTPIEEEEPKKRKTYAPMSNTGEGNY